MVPIFLPGFAANADAPCDRRQRQRVAYYAVAAEGLLLLDLDSADGTALNSIQRIGCNLVERAGRGPLVLSCSEGRRGRHAGGAARWPGDGQRLHQQIGALFENAAPDVNFQMSVLPGQTGVDIRVPFTQSDAVGFTYGEIKPLSASGLNTFNSQVNNWDLPLPVQAITYDAHGNIYLGFPGIQ